MVMLSGTEGRWLTTSLARCVLVTADPSIVRKPPVKASRLSKAVSSVTNRLYKEARLAEGVRDVLVTDQEYGSVS